MGAHVSAAHQLNLYVGYVVAAAVKFWDYGSSKFHVKFMVDAFGRC
jgi:hypothetical protein